MKLRSVYIKNFRNVDEITLECSPLTVLVGENNVGKTNILMAIYEILKMDESPYRVRFSEEDFYLDKFTNKRSDEIIIELTFDELDSNDTSAFLWSGIDFINNQFSVRLEAKWEEENNDANVEIFFYRKDDSDNPKGNILQLKDKKYIPFYYMGAYRDVRKETQYSKGDLKQIFKDYNKYFLKPLNIQITACIDNIDLYINENEKPENDEVIESLKDIKKYINGNNLDSLTGKKEDLELYISKLETKNETLNKIIDNINNILKKNDIQRKIGEIQSIINNLDGIEKIKESLQSNLALFVPEDQIDIELAKLEEYDFFDENKVYVKDDSILKQGSGLQSSFVIALKLSRLLAKINLSEERITNLIIAIEEPESHMHPHLQRSLVRKLKDKQKELLDIGLNVQLIITTHSPFILSQVDKSDIRLIKKGDDGYQINRFDEVFIQEIMEDMSPEKIKHFDYIFRVYPEIFLSRGVIIVEGRSEFGAIPEFVKKIPEVNLDDLGLTIINADSKDTIKPLYLIIKRFTKCIAIRDRDNEDTTNDNELIDDDLELYYKTDYKNIEEEIVNSVDNLKIIKILIQIDPKGAGKNYLNLLREHIPKTRAMNVSDILENWDDLNFDETKIKNENLITTLEKKCKTSLFWSMFCAELSLDDIPRCYINLIYKAKEMVI